MKEITLIAILGPSGSGKSACAMELAPLLDAEIFSLDSLSIYKEMDILSAKPSLTDRAQVKHYGIDVLDIPQSSNAALFKSLLLEAIEQTQKRCLLIVGGSSFFLKAIMQGLSPMPSLNAESRHAIEQKIAALKNPYDFLHSIDAESALKLKPQDTYRIHKSLEIFFATQMPPSSYFKANPPQSFPHPIHPFALQISRQILRQRVEARTEMMLEHGGLEEMQNLLTRYEPSCQPFKAIGPKECISFLQGAITYPMLKEQITNHTMQLAKRQNTFNKTQFCDLVFLEKDALFDEILRLYRA